MILEKSTGYWSVGITVAWNPDAGPNPGRMQSGWSGKLDFYDDGFVDDDADSDKVSTQGTLHTRYFVTDGEQASGLSAVVNVLLADAARLGVTFNNPRLFYEGDGEWDKFPPPPGWRETLNAEARRIGWAGDRTE